ncbi:sulfatase-like hydrolase/transferase [Persicobacter diffluens]
MYSNIYRMDQRVAQELHRLEKAKKLDNTIIIFASDNGGPGPRQKRSIYERGTHIPFIVVFPDGTQAGSVDNRMLNMADIPATILSLAGITPPFYMDGKAFLGEFEENQGRDYVFSIRERMDDQYGKQLSVRDSNFRYVRNYYPHQAEYLDVKFRYNIPSMLELLRKKEELTPEQASWFTHPRPKEELYFTEKDIHELNNLADIPEYQLTLERLRALADKVEAQYWPYKNFTEKELIKEIGNTGNVQVSRPSISQHRNLITLNASTPAASIVYQINGDGSKRSHWKYYTGPFKIRKGDRLKVIAARAGFEQSERVNYTAP